MVEPAVAHRAQQNGVGLKTGSESSFRQRLPIRLNGRATDAVRFEAELVAADVGHSRQHSYRLLGYFRADAIAGQYGNAQLHTGRISCGPCASRMPARCAYSMAIRSCS